MPYFLILIAFTNSKERGDVWLPHFRLGPCRSIGVTVFYVSISNGSSYTLLAQTVYFPVIESSEIHVLMCTQPDQGCLLGGAWEDRYWLMITLRNKIWLREREQADNMELGSTSRSHLHALSMGCTPQSFAVTWAQTWAHKSHQGQLLLCTDLKPGPLLQTVTDRCSWNPETMSCAGDLQCFITQIACLILLLFLFEGVGPVPCYFGMNWVYCTSPWWVSCRSGVRLSPLVLRPQVGRVYRPVRS
jgi:hypothetical protein